jgi:P27 family predicted phage terminase small subunit
MAKPTSSVAKIKKVDTPEFPEELGPEARRIWDRLLPAVIRENYYRTGDEMGLSMICFAYAQYLAASEAQHKYGAVLKTKNGNFVHSPYGTVANQYASLVISLLKEYGFTPASRGRLPSRLSQDPEWDELARFDMKLD